MSSFVNLAVLGKPEALKKFLPSVEVLLQPTPTATAKPRIESERGIPTAGVALSGGAGFLTTWCSQSIRVRRLFALTRCSCIRAESCPPQGSHRCSRNSSTGS